MEWEQVCTGGTGKKSPRIVRYVPDTRTYTNNARHNLRMKRDTVDNSNYSGRHQQQQTQRRWLHSALHSSFTCSLSVVSSSSLEPLWFTSK